MYVISYELVITQVKLDYVVLKQTTFRYNAQLN